MDDYEEVITDDREPIEDDDDADDEYVEDENEKNAQYEILDENGEYL